MMRARFPRPWVSRASERLTREVSEPLAGQPPAATLAEIGRLVAWNERIHGTEAVNLNPASNVMNPQAEALLSAGLGPRASLGHPGEKYETGLEAIERIEIIAAEPAAQVFDAGYAEVRVGSGALANLYAFMATCRRWACRCSPPNAVRAARTSSRCLLTATAAGSAPPAGCAPPTCWRAASACPSSRWPGT
ncbi:hypothetical protein ACIBQ1_50960 [Nonomuraea sp. NPDC050153]|uniref:hypothetical protein n=1 Tax=Nonomuraea sp. NPDC050153 TaxID=3364359 RepID=UPI0037A81663